MYIVSGAVVKEWETLSDEHIVAQVLVGRTALFEVLIRRHSERLFRTLRAILRDDRRAEDLLQQTFLQAYASLRQYKGAVPVVTWLTQVAVRTAAIR